MAMEFNYYIILLPIFFVLLLTIVGVNKIIPIEIAPVAHPEIDGVRGYLAFFVFLHHSYIWQHYIQTKSWDEPTLNLYNHFGQTSVSLFFGITAFLFTTKILKSTTDFNWGLYLKSRFYRLFPMYFTVTCVIFILIGYYTHLKLNTTIGELILTSASWIGFTVAGTLDINGFQNSHLMNSGASWTLPYEWMFYFLLPFLALAMGKKSKTENPSPISFTIGKHSLFKPSIHTSFHAIYWRYSRCSSSSKKYIFYLVTETLYELYCFSFIGRIGMLF